MNSELVTLLLIACLCLVSVASDATEPADKTKTETTGTETTAPKKEKEQECKLNPSDPIYLESLSKKFSYFSQSGYDFADQLDVEKNMNDPAYCAQAVAIAAVTNACWFSTAYMQYMADTDAGVFVNIDVKSLSAAP